MNEHPSWTSGAGHGGGLSRRWRMIAPDVELMAAVNAGTAWVVKRSSSAVSATHMPTRLVTVGTRAADQHTDGQRSWVPAYPTRPRRWPVVSTLSVAGS